MAPSTQALVVLDAQREYGPDGGLPVADLDGTLRNIEQLVEHARAAAARVVRVRHVSRIPGDSTFAAGSRGVEFLPGMEPADDDHVITKQYPGAFSNPLLDRYLVRHGVTELFVCGYTSFLCCDTTSREAAQLGYDVVYVDDAISEFELDGFDTETVHRVVSAIQGVSFSRVVSTGEAIRLLGPGSG